MYNSILLPTDGTPQMDPVVDHAGTLAGVHDATLHVVHVVNTASLNELPVESTWEGLSKALQEEGRETLNDVQRRVDDVTVETALLEGSPASEIVSYADTNDCDLIVMGTHGRSGVDRLLLGSVAERIVRKASVPVMTIGVDEKTPG